MKFIKLNDNKGTLLNLDLVVLARIYIDDLSRECKLIVSCPDSEDYHFDYRDEESAQGDIDRILN